MINNYAVEAASPICNLKADLPKGLANIATHNGTVNMTGQLGQGKPLDQLNEHYNLLVIILGVCILHVCYSAGVCCTVCVCVCTVLCVCTGFIITALNL